MHRTRFARLTRHLLWALLVSLGLSAPALASNPSSKQKVVQQKKQVAKSKEARPVKSVKQRTERDQKRRVASKKTTPKKVAKAQTPRKVVLAAAAVAAAPVESVGEQLGLRKVDDPLNLNSSVALVMDQQTHEILLGKNDTAVLPIASLTKLMTGLLVAEGQLPMDEVITIDSADVDRLKNSGSRLRVGSELTRAEALHLALMSSENRAAHALGRTYPGGTQAFVQRMNRRAAELGMTDTRFVDPTGLSSDNRSSARDLALLAAAAYQRPMLRDLSTSPAYEVASGRQVLQYRNSNRLVHNANWDIGLQKTGYIREAGRCLVMQVSVSGRQLIMVLLDAAGPAARVGDAERLRHWAESALFSSASPQGTYSATGLR
ncbi:serine hydrolase [Aquabacterium sp. A08]|uniref:serine hydrolase n=1 Tax=Aquabacterium sp. A08 TaxID=2718532 RepID=UPI0014215326|nr:serine hydrolase [Aquabacterium sp. A08]NIC40349.1 hypothetical protein [Aquabacterium sp. A08]